MPVNHAAIQRDSNRLEKWADRNLVKFNKRKCESYTWKRIIHIILIAHYVMGADQLENSSAEQDLEVLVDIKLT